MNLADALTQALESLRFADIAVREYRDYPSEAFRRSRLDDIAIAWLDYEHDVKTFGMPQDATVERLRQLLTV